jgi:hypothetical protein
MFQAATKKPTAADTAPGIHPDRLGESARVHTTAHETTKHRPTDRPTPGE